MPALPARCSAVAQAFAAPHVLQQIFVIPERMHVGQGLTPISHGEIGIGCFRLTKKVFGLFVLKVVQLRPATLKALLSVSCGV